MSHLELGCSNVSRGAHALHDVVVRLARRDGSDGSKPAAEGPERTVQGICLDAHDSATLFRTTLYIRCPKSKWERVIEQRIARRELLPLIAYTHLHRDGTFRMCW